MITIERTPQGSFDSAGRFASEPVGYAQDDNTEGGVGR